MPATMNEAFQALANKLENKEWLLRIVKDECQAYENNFRQTAFVTCTGLYNFQVVANPSKYADNQRLQFYIMSNGHQRLDVGYADI